MKMLIDTHTHTIASGHAYSTIMENAIEACKKGIGLLGITDHAPTMKGGTTKYTFINYRAIPRFVNGVEILMGSELNIIDYDGNVDLSEFILKGLDFTIASLHPPCLPFGSVEENTNALLKAMDNPYVNIIGHPGDPRYPFDVKAVVEKSISSNTLLEINNASLAPDTFRVGSEAYIREILVLCKKNSMPVILGSDAHFCTHVGEFQYALSLIEELKFPMELVLNSSIENFKNFQKKWHKI